MRLSRNTKRRLALYGCAFALGSLILLAPRAARRLGPDVTVRRLDPKAAYETPEARLLAEYVRIDTTNPPGNVRPAAEFLARIFACEGIPYEIVGDDPRRPIFVARLKGRSRDQAILLLHHMDVVPAGDLKSWAYPPFAAELGTGELRLHIVGRGTFDMKGQAIANFFAMAALLRAGLVPLHDVVFVGEPAEETFQPELGVGWLLDHRPDLVAGVTDVINEGGVNEALLDHIERFGVEVLQKSLVILQVEGKDAADLEALKKFLEDQNAVQPQHLDPTVERFLRFISGSRLEWGRYLTEPREALTAPRFQSGAPEVFKSYFRDSYGAGAVLPKPDGTFTMKVHEMLLPGSSVAAHRSELEGWVRARGFSSRPYLVTPDATASPEGGPAWNALMTTLSLDREQAEVGPYVLVGYFTSSQYIRSRGLRAYGFSPFNVNIEDAKLVHQPNERLNVVNFVEGVERMERFLREWATQVPEHP